MGRPRTRSDEEIVAAAMRVVGAAGPAGLTLAAVAAEAGLSPAALVQRFGSKRGLLLAAGAGAAERAGQPFAAARAAARSPLDALVRALAAMAAPVSDPVAFSNHLAFLHVDLDDPEFHASALAHARAVRGEIAALLAEAVAAGELGARDTERLAALVHAVYNGALLTWAIEREGSLDVWLRTHLDALLEPLRPPPARAG